MRLLALILLTGCGFNSVAPIEDVISDSDDQYGARTRDIDEEPSALEGPNTILGHCQAQLHSVLDEKVKLEQQLAERRFTKTATTKKVASDLMEGCLYFFGTCRFTIVTAKSRADFDVELDPRFEPIVLHARHQLELAPSSATYEVTGFLQP